MKDGEPMTLAEIAKIEGVSHQAVSEIIERALRKVRKILAARGMKLEDLL
jgi:DNA-directed RNA polymerase sigma subunit (sigma70/sigma32)